MGSISLGNLFRVFGRIGLISFGGPAAQIALMHKELVDDRRWLEEKDFLSALSFCMLLPGPEAMQLATYAGWKLRGTLGGLIAGLLFVLPGAAVILTLALLYAYWGSVPAAQAVFVGVKATVIVIVMQALLKLSKKSLTTTSAWGIAGLSFLGVYALNIPFPAIIVTAGIWGFLSATTDSTETVARPSKARTIQTVLIWGGLWAAPVAVIWLLDQALLLQIALFFSQLAVVTFGGAYAVLAYMTQQVVSDYNWLTTPEMIDALGLAETTPGPLILVTQFVGVLTGVKASGLWFGVLAGFVTLWVTFIPCFLWIFSGAPYLVWLSSNPRLSAALTSISAAVVGVILNLSIWFGLHVFFADVTQTKLGWLTLATPVPGAFQPVALGLALITAVLLFRFRFSILTTLGVMGLAGWLSALL